MQRRYSWLIPGRSTCIWLLALAALCSAPAFAASRAQAAAQAATNTDTLTAGQSREIVEAAWREIYDKFYDPKFRGVDWSAVHTEYLQRAVEVHNREQAVALVRQMIGLLHNSHSGVMTHAELQWMQNVLPLFFDRVDGRTFVSYVLQKRGEAPNPADTGVRFGDEIVSVDGQPAALLKKIAVSWLTSALSDPYYGPAGSAATLVIRRNGHTRTVKVTRVPWDGVQPVFSEQYGPVGYMRLLTLTSGTLTPELLRQAMDKVDASRGIILDLRECVGGDAPDADGLGGMLLGAGVKLVTRMTRAGVATVEKTVDFGPVYKGRVVVLVDGLTASEPEMLTAALKEYGRVTLVGMQTRGAFNGFTEGVPLPDRAGILVVPIDKGISPLGKEYEGIGVTPDVTVRNSARDYRVGRDRVLETGLRLAAAR